MRVDVTGVTRRARDGSTERFGIGESQHGARRAFHLGVRIPIRPDSVSVSRPNQEQALIWSVLERVGSSAESLAPI